MLTENVITIVDDKDASNDKPRKQTGSGTVEVNKLFHVREIIIYLFKIFIV